MAPRAQATGEAVATAAPAPVSLVVGEEEYLVDRTVRDLVTQARGFLAASAFAAGDGGGDVHETEGGDLTAGELASLTSPSLFGGGSVVVVRNAQNAPKEVAAELARYAAAPAPGADVIHALAGGSKPTRLATDTSQAGDAVVVIPR